jgi:hypothetical protein
MAWPIFDEREERRIPYLSPAGAYVRECAARPGKKTHPSKLQTPKTADIDETKRQTNHRFIKHDPNQAIGSSPGPTTTKSTIQPLIPHSRHSKPQHLNGEPQVSEVTTQYQTAHNIVDVDGPRLSAWREAGGAARSADHLGVQGIQESGMIAVWAWEFEATIMGSTAGSVRGREKGVQEMLVIHPRGPYDHV